MALVNIGVLMALWGKRVLLVDWDLEAPGLEAFFRKDGALVGDPSVTPGIIDLLEAQLKYPSLDLGALEWRQCLLQARFIESGLDIISAGRRSADYRTRVQNLNWDSLFKHGIGNVVNRLREEWRDAYDFVLIDSRTGITDIGDICTVLLPDAVILMFVTNFQNIEGVRSIMARAREARGRLPVDRSRLLGFPLPARDEIYNEYEKSVEWRNIFAAELGYLYSEWLPKEINAIDAFNKLFVPYVANWSFGERVPVLESQRELQDPTAIGAAYARVATLRVQ
jgi:cellulose biosynthesis protein BcsQ